MSCSKNLSLIVLLAAGIPVLRADVFNDRASFMAAITGSNVVTFNGLAPAGSFNSYGNGPLVTQGVTFTSNGSMFVIDPGFYGFSYAGGGFLNSDFTVPDIINATDGSHTAFGLDFGGLFDGSTTTFNLAFNNGQNFTATTSGSTGSGTLGFVGFTFTTPFTSVSITMPDQPTYNAIDNVTLGTANAPVPEPASILFLATVAAAWLGLKRRRA